MSLLKKLHLLPVLLVVAYYPATAQSKHITKNNFNTWFSWSADSKFSKKWGAHFDAQWRRSQFLKQQAQTIIRGGVNYYANEQLSFTAGYAFVKTFPYGKIPIAASFTENRIWEQMQLKSTVGKAEWIVRLRLEQRFSHLPVGNGNGYKPGPPVYTNRFRVLNRFTMPLGGKNNGLKNFYVTAHHEFLVNFGKNVGYNVFDQNRLYAGAGYKLSKSHRVEIGYLNQLQMKADGIKVENNNILYITLISNMGLRKK